MAKTAKKTDLKLWDKVKADITRADKGGKPGQWSARKAQIATHEYKKAGGGYRGVKSPDNHLTQWTNEEWGTKSGAESGESGERYLPKKAREHLSAAEYRRRLTRSARILRRADSSHLNPEILPSRPAKTVGRAITPLGRTARASGSKGHCGTLDDEKGRA